MVGPQIRRQTQQPISFGVRLRWVALNRVGVGLVCHSTWVGGWLGGWTRGWTRGWMRGWVVAGRSTNDTANTTDFVGVGRLGCVGLRWVGLSLGKI